MSETNGAVLEVPVVVKVNKSKLVKKLLRRKLDMPAADVIKKIKEEHGVDVTPSLVNTLRFKLKEKLVEENKTEVSSAADLKLEDLFAVKELAAKVGGLTVLKDLVNKLEMLAS